MARGEQRTRRDDPPRDGLEDDLAACGAEEAEPTVDREQLREAVREQLFGVGRPIALGRYRILGRLGHGGMAQVYAAFDPVLEREVAIKLMHTDRGADAEHVNERLLREGRALAQLTHPNILSVFDVGTEDGRAYIVLELVQGQTLSEWLAADPRGRGQILDVMLAAGSGLAAAHELGLVHRDVKPRNILIDEAGNARLGDFGLVRPRNGGPAPRVESLDVGSRPLTLTSTGTLVGTPAYMAPEQFRGEAVDAAADQFAFCVTFFEAVFGKRPFAGETVDDLSRAVGAGEVADPPESATSLGWLHEVIRRGLEPDPAARHPSMGALLEAVRSRRESIRSTEAALQGLGQLQRLREDGRLTSPERIRILAQCRGDLEGALEAWPDNADARSLERRVLEQAVEAELESGDTVAAAALMADLSDPPSALLDRLERARRARQDERERLARLAHLEHDADPNLSNRYKHVATASVAVVWCMAFLIFGWLTRSGRFEVGNGSLAIFYGAYFVLNVLSTLRFRGTHFSNNANRKLSHTSSISFGGHAFAALVGLVGGAPVALTLASAHTLATGLWLLNALTADRRVAVVAPFTGVGAVATVLLPSLCFEIAAAVALLGLGTLALLWREDSRGPATAEPAVADAPRGRNAP